jgi:pentapeptide MXKDX repeat protein
MIFAAAHASHNHSPGTIIQMCGAALTRSSRAKLCPTASSRTPRAPQYHPLRANFSGSTVTNDRTGASNTEAAFRRFQNLLSEELPIMTIRTRVTLGISAIALSLSLALAPAAFAQDKMAQDKMGKDDAMKKDTMSKDSMKKDSMSKDSMSKDTMSKDTMSKDGMKKDAGMMKKN